MAIKNVVVYMNNDPRCQARLDGARPWQSLIWIKPHVTKLCSLHAETQASNPELEPKRYRRSCLKLAALGH